MELQLRKACNSGNLSKVKKFLGDNPTFDVNYVLDGNGRTALHLACFHGHHEVVSVLVVHSQINVNQKTNYGDTPFLLGCLNGRVKVVKVLLKDHRVDINMAYDDGCIPLWFVSYRGYVEVIKGMIALRGDEVDREKSGKYDGEYSTAIEIARKENNSEMVSLLERFKAKPAQTRHELRVELGLVDELAAELFAMTVFICDDFLRLKEASSSAAAILRFFNIVTGLPMELQMVLCSRVFGSSKENIKSKDSEAAFKSLAGTF
jgi:hypothetical protein